MTTPPVEMSRRSRKKWQTRKALRDAALRLVLERGLKNVTVEDITESADVSIRTFYHHYSSKEAAIVDSGEDMVSETVSLLVERPPYESPLESLRHVLKTRLTLQNEAMRRATVQLVAENESLEREFLARYGRLEAALAQGVAVRLGVEGEQPGLYAELAAATAVGALRVATHQWGIPGAPSFEVLLDRSFEELSRGLPGPLPDGGVHDGDPERLRDRPMRSKR